MPETMSRQMMIIMTLHRWMSSWLLLHLCPPSPVYPSRRLQQDPCLRGVRRQVLFHQGPPPPRLIQRRCLRMKYIGKRIKGLVLCLHHSRKPARRLAAIERPRRFPVLAAAIQNYPATNVTVNIDKNNNSSRRQPKAVLLLQEPLPQVVPLRVLRLPAVP